MGLSKERWGGKKNNRKVWVESDLNYYLVSISLPWARTPSTNAKRIFVPGVTAREEKNKNPLVTKVLFNLYLYTSGPVCNMTV